MPLYLAPARQGGRNAVALGAQPRETTFARYAGGHQTISLTPCGDNTAEQNRWMRANAPAPQATKSRLKTCPLAPRLFWSRLLWRSSHLAAALARPMHARMSWPQVRGTPSTRPTLVSGGRL